MKEYRDKNAEKLPEYEQRRKKAAKEFIIRYREKRDKTFAMTFQQQMDHFYRQQKTTREKLEALGPKNLRVTQTDYLKSPPSRDPVPYVDLRTPVVMYLESFCQSLDVEEEEDLSFLDMLNQEDMNEPELNMLNLDSNQIETMDHHVWDTVASDSLGDLITQLDEQSALDNNVDFDFDFVDFDMTPDDWENVWNDVLDNFDFNLF